MSKNNEVTEQEQNINEVPETQQENNETPAPVVDDPKKPGFLKKYGKTIATHGLAFAAGIFAKAMFNMVFGNAGDQAVDAAENVVSTAVDGVTTTTF